MKKYIQQQQIIEAIRQDIKKYLKGQRNQVANISSAIYSVNYIFSKYGYHLANADGTHHNQVYSGSSGQVDIAISDKHGTLLSYVLRLDWKMLETGLGWKVDFRLKLLSK